MQIGIYSKLEERLKSLPNNRKHLISFMDKAASIEKNMGAEEHPYGSLIVVVIDH